MTTAFYRNGTVAVTQNSKVVTGTNTNWATGATKPLAGDVFVFNNKIYEIENVISNTEIRLFRNFEDANASNQAYMIMRNASLNISSRIAAQVAQVVNQKQIMLDEFENFLTNNKDALVYFTDTLGNKVPVTPIPMLDASHNQAIADLNKKADDVISSQILMTEAEAMAQADAYEQIFAAAGMVHMGKQYNDSRGMINEGMWVHPSYDNEKSSVVHLGRRGSDGVGESKTNFPVTYIAGAIANIMCGGKEGKSGIWDYDGMSMYVPPAEAGTRVHDSTGNVRNSGKPSLDLRYDNDPKYGDSPSGTQAQILREATGRAFEGLCKNGDFRNGMTAWSNYQNYVNLVIADGKATASNASNSIGGIQTEEYYVQEGDEYVVSFFLHSGTVRARRTIIDTSHNPNNEDLTGVISETGFHTVTYTAPASYATNAIWFEVGKHGGGFELSNISVHKVSEEVVTHPVDQLAWESYDEELTGRTEIMEDIQSVATTFGDTDVPTVLSTRPNSYFDYYEGQSANPDAQNTRYRCVVWDDLPDSHKRKVAAYMGNKLYLGERGNLVNRRLRARTFRGLGNGDWANIDSAIKGTSWNQFLSFATSYGAVRPQGSLDSSQAFATSSGDSYATTPLQESSNDPYYQGAHQGAFAVWNKSDQAYKRRCYLYIIASIPRANQGAYHPTLNPFGTRRHVRDSVGDQSSRTWNASDVRKPVSTAQCFQIATYSGSTGYARDASGNIGGISGSGHPDGIYYDGIETGGLNGIIDWRLPAVANDSPEEQAKVQSKLESRAYRGLDKPRVCGTKVVLPNVLGNAGDTYISAGEIMVADIYGKMHMNYTAPYSGYAKNLDCLHWLLVRKSDGVLCRIGAWSNQYHSRLLKWDGTRWVIEQSTAAEQEAMEFAGFPYVYDKTTDDDSSLYYTGAFPQGWNGFYVTNKYMGLEMNLSMSGEFMHTEVVSTLNLLASNPDIQNGFLGSWIGIPAAAPNGEADFSRKVAAGVTPQRVYWSDVAKAWTDGSMPNFSDITNGTIRGWSSNTELLYMFNYKAWAKPTVPSGKKQVLNAKAGLMSIIATNDYRSFLGDTLINKPFKSNGQYPRHKNLAIDLFSMEGGNLFSNDVRYMPHHAPLYLGQTANNSRGIKVLTQQISENGKASLAFQANELTWDNIDLASVVQLTSLTEHVGVRGQVVRMPKTLNSNFAGQLMALKQDYTFTPDDSWWSQHTTDQDGNLYYRGDSPNTYFRLLSGRSFKWGDDGVLKITATDNGEDIFFDLNGLPNISVSQRLAIPSGWVKRKARSGIQTKGVDL